MVSKYRKTFFFWISFFVLSSLFMLISIRLSGIKTHRSKSFEEKLAYAHKKWNESHFDSKQLKTGDLLLRRGIGFFSDELRKLSLRENKYSHCGFITINSKGTPLVLHSIGGSDNPDARIRCDSLFVFCDANEATSFAVYRFDQPDKIIARADSIARKYYREKRKFDMKFNLDDDEKLYCAEFLYKIWINATEDKFFLPLSVTPTKTYVGIDDLYLNNHCTKIYEYEYN